MNGREWSSPLSEGVDVRSDQMTLADGRTLAWDEYGALDSATVLFHNHGTGSSRREPALYDDLFTEIELRVVVPDRPGYGGSTGLPAGRPLIDWADDAAQLVAALGLDWFATSGYSGGGRHALALAASDALGAQVTRVIVQAGNAPDQPLERDRDREIAEMVATLSWDDFTAGYTSNVGDELANLAPADEERVADPAFVEAATAAVGEGARQGALGEACDGWAWALPWGFELAAVTQPADVWHGDADTIIPIAHAHALHAGLPESTLHVLPGDGHFSISRHFPEQVAVLVATR